MSEASELSLPLVIDGKYRVGGLLGEGAMGRVHGAEHLLLGHRVAIKFLRASVDDETTRSRFVREAKATMALRSEHIVRVFDLGILPSKTPYMVLEYLEGIDLRSLLDLQGALPIEEAVDYTLQACEALAEAHANGIVHRDLKPHNLFRARLPNGGTCIKLLDFGVSKLEAPTAQEDHELTSSQVLLGSPVFMPPEQIRASSRVDARADVWSLGVVLYMLVGGGRPFEGEGLTALCASIMVDPPRPLADRCAAVPKALEEVVFACLEKSRDRRMPNVVELARGLAPFASAEGRLRAQRIARSYGALVQRAADPPVNAGEPASAPGASPATAPRAELGIANVAEHTAVDSRSPGTAAASTASPAESLERTSTALATPIEVRAIDASVDGGSAGRGRGSSRRPLAFAAVVGAALAGVVFVATFVSRRAPPSSAPLAAPAEIAATSSAPPAAATIDTSSPAASASSDVGSAPSAGPPSRPRRVLAPKRAPAKNVSAKTPQVDRNGVPILD